MSNNPLYNHLLEQLWRGKLTAAEEQQLRAWLAAHPEAKTDFELESGLNQLLVRLPNAPMPSNFTARVLKAVEVDAVVAERERGGIWHWRPRWLPRVAFASVLIGVGLISYREGVVLQQARLAHNANLAAQSVAVVSDVSSLPSPDILTNFDAVLALNQTPAADEQLLALLK